MAAYNPPDTPERTHSTEALHDVWAAYHVRRDRAVELADRIDSIDAYIAQTREALARAEADRNRVAGEHEKVLAAANELRDMVVGHCDRHGLQLPKDPEPQPPAGEAAVHDPARRRALSAAEAVQALDPYAHLLGERVKVFLRGQIEVYAGVLQSLDTGQGRMVLLDLMTGEPYWWPERALVERIERYDDPPAGDSGESDEAVLGRMLGGLPPRVDGAEATHPDASGQADAVAAGPRAWVLLAVGVWLAAGPARCRRAWVRSGHWRHRAGALHSAVRPGAVRGATV